MAVEIPSNSSCAGMLRSLRRRSGWRKVAERLFRVSAVSSGLVATRVARPVRVTWSKASGNDVAEKTVDGCALRYAAPKDAGGCCTVLWRLSIVSAAMPPVSYFSYQPMLEKVGREISTSRHASVIPKEATAVVAAQPHDAKARS